MIMNTHTHTHTFKWKMNEAKKNIKKKIQNKEKPLFF